MDVNYYDTFIFVAPDCPATNAMVPPEKKSGMTKPAIEYELLSNNPYGFTQEELLFEVHVRHKMIPAGELEERRDELKEEFFKKSQPCLIASMLPKKYGWGIHFDTEGKAALVPMESVEYEVFVKNDSAGLKLLAAMRNKRIQKKTS